MPLDPPSLGHIIYGLTSFSLGATALAYIILKQWGGSQTHPSPASNNCVCIPVGTCICAKVVIVVHVQIMHY